MSTTPNGIEFQELGGSPTMEISTQGVSGQRIFWVPNSNDLTPFLQEVIGQWILQGQNQQSNQSGQCLFIEPMPYPGYPNLVPTDIRVEPKMPDSPEGTFQVGVTLNGPTNDYKSGWKVTVQYSTVYNTQPWNINQPTIPTGTYLTYSADLGGEMMELPGTKYYWCNSPGIIPVDENGDPLPLKDKEGEDIRVPQLIPTGNYTLTWERVLEPPWTTIRQTRGKINNAAFMGAPAGTVMFLGAQIERQYQFTVDAGFWKVQYKFSERSITLNSGSEAGWNYFYAGKLENWSNTVPTAGFLQLENWLTVTSDAGTPNAQGGPWTTVTGSAYTPLFNTATSTYVPPYESADFTALFLFDNNITC